MKPTDLNPEFGVCPECGGDTKKEDNKWVCTDCNYEEEI